MLQSNYPVGTFISKNRHQGLWQMSVFHDKILLKMWCASFDIPQYTIKENVSMNTTKGQELYTHAKQIIPGGVQLLSKRPEMFAPDKWPAYAQSAKGCTVTDIDGNTYYDMTTNGIGACLLGFADPDVTEAVTKRIQNGSMTSLCAPEEVYLADRLCEIHPWANQVRFARTGGEICAIAVRIARATTGRSLVAISGYHGWSDWYLAANLANDHSLDGVHLPGLEPAGVPKELTGTSYTFIGNDVEAFDKLMAEHGDELACVIMEPMRNEPPKPGYLEHVRERTHKAGALLIFDEITIGWRNNFGGSHKVFGVNPDMAVFAKAMGNGHPIAAVIGTKEAMDGAHNSFISSTYWTEAVGPTAALATIDKMEKTKIWEHAKLIGETVQNDWNTLGKKHSLKVSSYGNPCLSHFSFGEYPLELKTLYTVLMLEEGFLANTGLYPTLAHTPEIMDRYREAIDKVFETISEIIKKGGKEAVVEALEGKVCQSGFKRLLK